jgi:polyisoprenoid-binding protein YceI
MTTTAPDLSRTATWVLDPMHTRIGFAARHLGINLVRGRFETFEGSIEIPGDLSSLTASGVIDAGSLTTHLAMRDDHLRSAAFFDVEHHPEISFRTVGVTPLGGEHTKVAGEITIRGVTRPISLEVEAHGTAVDQYGNERVGFAATGTLRRTDFGMPYDDRVAGIPLVGDRIHLQLDIEAIKQD